jgi:hypothetical protein
MAKRKKKRQPMILADEHLHPSVIKAVEDQGWFKVLRATHDHRFRGRDEWDYVSELRSLNIVFFTQDNEFVQHVVTDRVRHGG